MTRSHATALASAHRKWLVAVGLLTLVSGLAWVGFHWAEERWLAEAAARRIETIALRVHGFGAMLSLIALGSLLPRHIAHGVRGAANRRAGIVLLAAVVLLAVTGYLLYYSGDEGQRALASDAHIILGFAVPFAFALHYRYRKRSRSGGERRTSRARSSRAAGRISQPSHRSP